MSEVGEQPPEASSQKANGLKVIRRVSIKKGKTKMDEATEGWGAKHIRKMLNAAKILKNDKNRQKNKMPNLNTKAYLKGAQVWQIGQARGQQIKIVVHIKVEKTKAKYLRY